MLEFGLSQFSEQSMSLNINGFFRWIFDNNHLFKGKKVLEVGSGPGLCGLGCCFVCKAIDLI